LTFPITAALFVIDALELRYFLHPFLLTLELIPGIKASSKRGGLGGGEKEAGKVAALRGGEGKGDEGAME
jgi:hypothetical protein